MNRLYPPTDPRLVAQVYDEAIASGRPPRLAVAKAFNLSVHTASARIQAARTTGHLPAVGRGTKTGNVERHVHVLRCECGYTPGEPVGLTHKKRPGLH